MSVERRDHIPTDIRESGEVHSGNLGLIFKNEDRLEPEFGPVEVRQHNRCQPRLVLVGYAIQKQWDIVFSLDSIVYRVSLSIWHIRFIIPLHFGLVYQMGEEIFKIVVERGPDIRSGKKRQVIDLGQRLSESKDGLRQPVGSRVETQGAAILVPLQSTFVHDAFEKHPPGSIHEHVDIVLIADVHERVAAVRQPQSTRCRF